MSNDIASIRREYTKARLSQDNLPENPIRQFEQWFNEALKADVRDANAMHLATVDPSGKPSIRVVLLKEVNKEGFVFFTNYNSEKGRHLKNNPFCSVNFYWAELERQVRVEGSASKISPGESDEYFDSRPEGSRIAAIASPQSELVDSRESLEEMFKAAEHKWAKATLKRPPHWGGYVIIPEKIEFWQGRENRLHDRIRYSRLKSGNWTFHRLAP